MLSIYTAGIVLTNDGNAILREIDVTHPAAKVTFAVDYNLSILSCGQ